MNWYKRQLKLSQSSFTPEELVSIGYNLLDFEHSDEDTGEAVRPGNIPNSNYVDTRYIGQLGRFLVANQGDMSNYVSYGGELSGDQREPWAEREIPGAISELHNIISINPTLAQPFDEASVRDIKILISQLERMRQMWA